MSENENIKTWQKIAAGVITGAILMVLANVGQMFYVQFTVKENTKDIELAAKERKALLRQSSFLRYMELVEERQKYLKEGQEDNKKAIQLINEKLDTELKRIRELGDQYRGATTRK